jgi:hypothetical protein
MRLHYKYTFVDQCWFIAVHQFCLPSCQVVFIAFGAMAYFIASEESGTGEAVMWAIALYFAGWALQFVFNIFAHYSSGDRSVLTDHVVESQADCFYEENPFSRSFYKWAGIAKVVSRPGFVAVYTSAHFAHVIPNRFFADRKQRREFLRLIRGKLATA